MTISLTQVSKSFEEKTIIKDLSFVFPEQGVVTLTGPSGCGKTTLLRLVLGLLQPDSGEVYRSTNRFSVVFETDALLPWLDALGNVALPLKGDTKKAEKALEEVGLGAELHTPLHMLSGGMRRRVALARALAFEGDVLVLDEPTIRLDDDCIEEVMNLFCKRWQQKLIIMVTHNQEVAQRYSDEVYYGEGLPLSIKK